METLALFYFGIGQVTQFIPARDCLVFPCDTNKIIWYEDKQGNKYSFFEAMCKFYK